MDHHETSERVRKGPLSESDGSGVTPLPSSTAVTGDNQRPNPRGNSTECRSTANGSETKFLGGQSRYASPSPGVTLGASGNGAAQSGSEGANINNNPPIDLMEGTSLKSGGARATAISSPLATASSLASLPANTTALPMSPIASGNGEQWSQPHPAETLDMSWDTLTIGENLHGNGDHIDNVIRMDAVPGTGFESTTSLVASSHSLTANEAVHPVINGTTIAGNEPNTIQNRTLPLGASSSSAQPIAVATSQPSSGVSLAPESVAQETTIQHQSLAVEATNEESVSHAAADLPTGSDSNRQNRSLFVDTYSPYIHPDDTSLDAARARLRTALDQTRILRAAFTDRVYQKYRVVLRPVPKSVDEMIEQITSDPASTSLQLHEEIKMVKEEKELEKKEAAKLNAAVAAANNSGEGGGSSAAAAETAEQLAFFGAGLSLVILPEEEIDENEIDISNLEHRGPTDPETGHRVGKISSAAAAAAEALLDRVRKGGAMRMERNRRRQMQALSSDASGFDSGFENSTMMMQSHITRKGFIDLTSSNIDASRQTVEASGKTSKQSRRHGSPKGSIPQSTAAVDGGKSSRARSLTTATGIGLLSMSANAEGTKSAAVAALISCGIGKSTSTSKSGSKGASQAIRWKHPHPDSMAGRRQSLALAALPGQSSKKGTAATAAASAAALYAANLPAELRSLALPATPQHINRKRTRSFVTVSRKVASKSVAESAINAVLEQFHLGCEFKDSDRAVDELKSDKTSPTPSTKTIEKDDKTNAEKSESDDANSISKQIGQQQPRNEQKLSDVTSSPSTGDGNAIKFETSAKETEMETQSCQKQGNRLLKRKVTEIGFLRGIQTARNTSSSSRNAQSAPDNISCENSSFEGMKAEGQRIDPMLAFSVLKAVGFIQDAPSTFSSHRDTESRSRIRGSGVAELIEASQKYESIDENTNKKQPSNDGLKSKPSQNVLSSHIKGNRTAARKRSFTEIILAEKLNDSKGKKQRQTITSTPPEAESLTSSQRDLIRQSLDQRIEESQACVLHSIRGGGESKLDLKDDSYFAEGRTERTSNEAKEIKTGPSTEQNAIGDGALFVAPSPVGSPDSNLALSGLHVGGSSNTSQSASTSIPTAASMSMGAPHLSTSIENAYSLMPQAPISGSADPSQYAAASQTANGLAAALRLQNQQHSAGLEHFHHHTVTSSVTHQAQHLTQSSLHQAASAAISHPHPHSHHNSSDISDYYGSNIQGYGASHPDWSSLGASPASSAGLIPTHSTLAASMGLSQHRAAAMVSLSMRERAARALLVQERQQVVAAHARAQAAAAAAHHQTAATARGGAGISSLSPQQAAAFMSGNSIGGPGSTSAYASAPGASRFSHLGAHSAASAAALLSSQATSALLARQQHQQQHQQQQEQPCHQQQKKQPKQQRQQKQMKQQQKSPLTKAVSTTKKLDPALTQQRAQTQNSLGPPTQKQQKPTGKKPSASSGQSPYFGNTATGGRTSSSANHLATSGAITSSSMPKQVQPAVSLPKSEDTPAVSLQRSAPQAQSKYSPNIDSGGTKDPSTISKALAKKASQTDEKTVGNAVSNMTNKNEPLESDTGTPANSEVSLSDSTASHKNPLEMKAKATLTVPKASLPTLATAQDPLSNATAAAAAATAAASTDGMRFFVPDVPSGLSTEFSDFILNSLFHKAAALAMTKSAKKNIDPNLAKLLIDYLLAVGSAVPIPKALIANPLKERLNTSCFKGAVQGSGSSNVSAPISREVITASIAIWLWVQHKECFQKAFAKSGRIDVDPECKWLIHSAIEASTCALITELPGGGVNSGGGGKGASGKLTVTGGTRDTKGSTPSGMNEIRVASIVSESLMREICINEEMNEALPHFEDLVHLLDELRLEVLRAKSQERVLLAALIARRTNMSESFSHAYVSSLVRAGEALGHEEICETVQDEATSSSSALPYDILSDSTGAWEDPCRPSSGYLPGLTGDELRKRAHARALIQKSLKKLQDRNSIKGGTASVGPYGDSSQSSSINGTSVESSSGAGGGSSTATKSHPSPAKGSLKRKTSISALSDAGRAGSGHVSAATAVLFDPNHYSSPLIWNTDDIVNMPYGRHDLMQRNRSSRAGHKANRSGSKRRRVSNVRQSHVPVMSSPNSSRSSVLIRSTQEIDWSDVAKMFNPTAQGAGGTDRSSSSAIYGGDASSPAVSNADIFAPYCRKIDVSSLPSEDSDESDDEEDISDDTVLARHQEVLDKMKKKIDIAMEMRQQQQSQSQRSRSRSTSGR